MSDLHITYMNVCSSNGVNQSVCKVRNRKELKCLMQEEIQVVEFSHPKCKNESKRVSLKLVNDVGLMKFEEQDDEGEMKTLFSSKDY